MSILHTPTSSISSLAPDSPPPVTQTQLATPVTDSENAGNNEKSTIVAPTPVSNGNSNSTTPGATQPPKRKPSRRANTAERRATHNAVERQRRETLNGRFLDLAALLPNLASVRRPSKSAIVNSSIALIHSARRQRVIAAREMRGLLRECEALRRECNEWRDRAGLMRCEEPVRSAEVGVILSAGEGVDEYAVSPVGQQAAQISLQQQQHHMGDVMAGTQGWWEPENLGAMGEEERRAYEIVMRSTSSGELEENDEGIDEEDEDASYGNGIVQQRYGGAMPKQNSSGMTAHQILPRHQHHQQRQGSTGSAFSGFEGQQYEQHHLPAQYTLDAPQLDKFGNWTTQSTAQSNGSTGQWAHGMNSPATSAHSPTSGSPLQVSSHGLAQQQQHHGAPHSLNINLGRAGPHHLVAAAGQNGLFTPPGTASGNGNSPVHHPSNYPYSGGEDASGADSASSVGSGSPLHPSSVSGRSGGGSPTTSGLGLGSGLGGMMGGVDQWGMPMGLSGMNGGLGMNGGMNGSLGMVGVGAGSARGGMMMAMM